ncbi:MAG: hypothetical protein HQL75_13310 [Magnetococcales bacterium]|nr:hypothetical protein [Magnetococcales bacterium]
MKENIQALPLVCRTNIQGHPESDWNMFSTLTPRFLNNREIRSWFVAIHAVGARIFALAHLSALSNPHLFHHWDVKARLAALFSMPALSIPRTPHIHLHLPHHRTFAVWLGNMHHILARINPLVHLDDRYVPHPGDIAQRMVHVSRDLWAVALEHLVIFLGGYEQLEIIIKTDHYPKQIITPAKGKRIIIFGSGSDNPKGKKEYIHIPDDELFHEHLIIGYSRFHGWRIQKMEGEFGCGFQYSTDSLNASYPLTDCAIMRIGHTSVLINIHNKH